MSEHNHEPNVSTTACPACMDESKDFIQRGRRGFADCDVWSLDMYIAGILANALPELAKLNNSCPPELCDDGDVELGCERWHLILGQMAEGFAEFADDHDSSRPRIKTSLILFSTWFGDLWD
jgi:hypothetical protein